MPQRERHSERVRTPGPPFARASLALLLLTLPMLSACAECGRCRLPGLTLTVELERPLDRGDAVSLSVAADCRPTEARWLCTTGDLADGDYDVVVSAPGHADERVAFTIAPRGPAVVGDCLPCADSHDATVSLVAGGASPSDAGPGDGG